MTRAKISEYSATANDNTDVNGINIAEGCPPSSMNNMGREIMAALKRFQVGSDGDGVTVGGSLVVSGSTSVNTFNVDVISEKTSAAGVTVDGVLLKDGLVGIGADGTASAPSIYRASDTNTGLFFPAADTIGLAVGGVEAARLVSGALSVPANSSGPSFIKLFEDTDNGTNSVDIIAPSAITSDRTLTIPDASGTIDRLNRAGNVLQVVSVTTSTETVITSTSYTDITNLTASITPTSASNKILVLVSLNGRQSTAQTGNRRFFYNIVRTSTQIFESIMADTQAGSGVFGYIYASAHSLIHLDSPSTTSSVTYKCQAKVNNTADSTAIEVNSAAGNSSSITLMEIAA